MEIFVYWILLLAVIVIAALGAYSLGRRRGRSTNLGEYIELFMYEELLLRQALAAAAMGTKIDILEIGTGRHVLFRGDLAQAAERHGLLMTFPQAGRRSRCVQPTLARTGKAAW